MVWLHIHILRWEQLYWGYLFKAWYANAILESALLETIRKWLENNLIRNTTGSSAVSSRCSRVNKCSYHCRCSEIERETANAFCSPCEMKFLTGLIQGNLEKSPSAKSWWRMIETSSLSRDEEGTVCIIAGKQGGEETRGDWTKWTRVAPCRWRQDISSPLQSDTQYMREWERGRWEGEDVRSKGSGDGGV